MTSSSPCWWTKTKDLSLASFVRPPEVVNLFIVIGFSRGWLETSYCACASATIYILLICPLVEYIQVISNNCEQEEWNW